MSATASDYRADIDGLRAVAVISVVVFHAFPALLRGGFIGVDVFFVISGYLITRIILSDLHNGSFSLAEFYSRRIRRIFPALLTVLATCVIAGALLLMSDEYRQLGKHIAAGAGFVSNFALWGESGYFDTAAEAKPLLHLWSLGIEEQFYLVWPLLVLVFWRTGVGLAAVTAFAIVWSFKLSAAGVAQDPVATFYSPLTRLWELLAGGLLAWFALAFEGATFKKLPRGTDIALVVTANTLSLAGAALLVIGFATLHSGSPFPGKNALYPVLGTVFLIAAGPRSLLNRFVLSNRVLVGIGLISFPLYLWHWPLLSFMRIVDYEAPSDMERGAAVIAAIVLAWLTYRLIERPVRFGGARRVKAAALVGIAIVIGGAGYATYQGAGLNFRTKEKDEFLASFENVYPTFRYFRENNLVQLWRSDCQYFNRARYMETGALEGGVADSRPRGEIDPVCYTRDPAFKHAVMIWGDSHAQVLGAGVAQNLPKTWQLLQVASAGCAPNPDIIAPSAISQCDQSNFRALKTIAEASPDVVVVARATDHSVEWMNRVGDKLKSLGAKRIVFVGPVPIWRTTVPKVIARYMWDSLSKRTFYGADMDRIARNEALKREIPNLRFGEYVDVFSLLCNDQGCITHLGDDRKATATAFDPEHMTLAASDYIAKARLIEAIVGKPE